MSPRTSTSPRREGEEVSLDIPFYRIARGCRSPRGRCQSWRTNGEYSTMPCVVLRTCRVSVTDIRDVEHSVEVTAETLCEAVATALAALQQDN
jgi:hypothetical protein